MNCRVCQAQARRHDLLRGRHLLRRQASPKGSSPAFIFPFSSLRPKEAKKKTKNQTSIELRSHLPPPRDRAAGVNGRGGKKQSAASTCGQHRAGRCEVLEVLAALGAACSLSPSTRAAPLGRGVCRVPSATLFSPQRFPG